MGARGRTVDGNGERSTADLGTIDRSAVTYRQPHSFPRDCILPSMSTASSVPTAPSRSSSADAPLIVGRAPTSDVPVVDPTISRRHAELIVDEEQVTLRDLGSSNGTFVNGAQGRAARDARGGRLITFGKVAFRLATYVRTPHGPRSRCRRRVRGEASAPTIVRADVAPRPPHAVHQPRTRRRPRRAACACRRRSARRRATRASRSSRCCSRSRRGSRARWTSTRCSHKIVEYAYQIARRRPRGDPAARRAAASWCRRSRATSAAATHRAPCRSRSRARRSRRRSRILVRRRRRRTTRFSGAVDPDAAGPLGDLRAAHRQRGPRARRALRRQRRARRIASATRISSSSSRSPASPRSRSRTASSPSASGARRSCAATSSATSRRSWPQRIASAPEAIKLGGDKRTVAVLFSDIRGFTALSETMKPDEMAQPAHRVLHRDGGVRVPTRRHAGQVHRRRGHGAVGRADRRRRTTPTARWRRRWT